MLPPADKHTLKNHGEFLSIMAFCPQCGKDAVDVFCEECLRAQTPLVADIKPVVLQHCTTCDRMKVRGSWTQTKDFDRWFQNHFVFAPNAVITHVEFPFPVIEPDAKEFVLPVLIEGTISQRIEPYEEEYEVEVKISREACDRCALAKSTYFEGFLQLRNPKEEVVAYIESTVRKNPDVFITKAEDVRGGIDFWFTDQKYLQPFVHELRKKFGGVVKTQSKLHTYDHQKSKPVYRLTCLIRLPKFNRGDIIETKDRLIKISQMGSRVVGFDLQRRKNSSIDCPTDDEVTILESEEVVISRTQPKSMYLDPDTYQEEPLAHQVTVEPGSTHPIVFDAKGKAWVARKLPDEFKPFTQ